MGLFGRKRRKNETEGLEAALVNRFFKRAQVLQLGLEQEEIVMALQYAKVQALEEDAVFRLPPNYGDLLIKGYQADDPDCVRFVNRVLVAGALPQDLIRWWNLPDLERRMLVWEARMIVEDRAQKLVERGSESGS